MRRVLIITGWSILVLLPVFAIYSGFQTALLIWKGFAVSPIAAIGQVLVAVLPALVFGLAVGSACLVIASIDKRLQQLEKQ